jgi:hypothetical protein
LLLKVRVILQVIVVVTKGLGHTCAFSFSGSSIDPCSSAGLGPLTTPVALFRGQNPLLQSQLSNNDTGVDNPLFQVRDRSLS